MQQPQASGCPCAPQVKELAAAFAAAERAEGGAGSSSSSFLDMAWSWNLGLLQQVGYGGIRLWCCRLFVFAIAIPTLSCIELCYAATL